MLFWYSTRNRRYFKRFVLIRRNWLFIRIRMQTSSAEKGGTDSCLSKWGELCLTRARCINTSNVLPWQVYLRLQYMQLLGGKSSRDSWVTRLWGRLNGAPLTETYLPRRELLRIDNWDRIQHLKFRLRRTMKWNFFTSERNRNHCRCEHRHDKFIWKHTTSTFGRVPPWWHKSPVVIIFDEDHWLKRMSCGRFLREEYKKGKMT